ncbi:MAG: 4-(cytidine 5'-diphospho)-2-C-methyl-D-erythritol kinase [Rhodospirillales bacterium]|nr:MAG: 4-(cytidine 5'-diphospho)-2-C-methyl-D-erythritol kinase [Rhodospirillales bacterium]
MDGGATVVREGRAKVNLYLRVVGRRPDGFHLLDSLVVFADAADRIEASPSPSLVLEVDGPFAAALAREPPDSNLVLRAARALAGRAGVSPRARLRLVKNLPVAAGLGGGSTDAAAALRALVDLWSLAMPEEELFDLAASLGADVPMCLAGRPALVSGVGERVAPAPTLPAFGLLLVNPGVASPTPEVFRAFAAARPAGAPYAPADPPRAGFRAAADLARALAARGNDLTDAALSRAPAIGAALAALRGGSTCRYAAMSGSGATCFGIYDDAAAAAAAGASISAARPAWWVRAGVAGA